MNNRMDDQELISALADGQLRGEALAHGVRAAAGEPGQRTWRAYCVIGEILRTGRAPAGTAPEAFVARFRARLQREQGAQASPVVVPVGSRERAAANDWRWKVVAGVASVAAVTAVGWNMWGATGMRGAQPQLAAAPAGVPAAVIPVAADPRAAPMLRDPRLDRLLQAHRQMGAATPLQTPPVYLRQATFEGPAR